MQQDVYDQISKGMNKAIIDSFLFSLKNFWYLWGTLIVIVLVKAIHAINKIYKIRKAGLLEIDKMSGTDFEIFLEGMFIRLGYKVERVGKMADFGADLIIEKDGIRIAVQAKRWNNPVNVKAIQEINTAQAHYNATKAIVVTNSRFTSNATKLARENKVELINRQRLATLIIKSNN